MKLQYHLTEKSGNRKTGEIPVSTTSRNSCPEHCPLKREVIASENGKEKFEMHGCFGDGGPIAIHWKRVSELERGYPLAEFTYRVRNLDAGQVWRHNQVGDLPSQDNVNIDATELSAIVDANTGKRGFTYTHYDPNDGNNAEIIRDANARGFTINLSADNLREADAFKALAIAPVTVLLPINQHSNVKTPEGNLVVVCPKETPLGKAKGITCGSCQLCALPKRKPIIGFPAHGSSKKKTELVALG